MFKPIYLLIVFVIVISWFQRHILFENYDPEYMHDFYSFSQWSIPLSSRIMGDADLYSYSGYSLTQDFKPFGINPETGIFGKLFFGYSALLFGNHHLASPLFLLLLIIALDILAKKYFKFDSTKRIFLALFIFSSAEIQEQVKLTLLDLPQVAIFAWHLVFLFKSFEKNNRLWINLGIAGLLLGFFSATKFGVYVPIMLLADTWYLFKQKQLQFLPILLLTTVSGYVFPYLPIIFSEGIVSFIGAQKWILSFYLSSGVIAPIGMLLITAFTGMYKGWVGTQWEPIYTWNGEWAIGIIALVLTVKEWIQTKTNRNNELGVLLVSLSLIFLLLIKLPFWPRYFIFFIPFFWLLILKFCNDKKMLLLLLVFPLISTSKLILQSLDSPNDYLNSWNLGAYEELYNYFSSDLKNEITRKEFVASNLLEYENLQPNEIKTELLEEKITSNELEQIVAVTLKSYFGEKTIHKQVNWRKEHSKWKITKIENLSQEKFIINSTTQIICINPVKVQDWGNIYAALNEFYNTKDSSTDYRSRVMKLIPRDYCIPVGEVPDTPKAQEFIFPNGFEKHTSPSIQFNAN